jgi:uncharacterized protein DUF1206
MGVNSRYRVAAGAAGHRHEVLMRVVQRFRRSPSARVLARTGLLARGFLYLLLAYLAASVAAGWGRDGTQANANGALTAVASQPAGWLALLGAAIGFAAFGVMRLAGSYGDRSVHGFRRLTTAGQATFYLAMSGLTVAFLAGDRKTGSAQQQDSTSMTLVSSTPGRLVMAGVGIAIVCVCLWQIRLAVQGGFADSLSTEHLDQRAEGAAKVVGSVGIAARAASVLPIGGLMALAAAQAKPKESRDLDQLLQTLVKQPLGHALVWIVTLGFLVFALYSFLEVRYREVDAGD